MSAETIHAGCVAVAGRGVLIAGRSGAGKSDLALRLIDRGAVLVSDDYTCVEADGERLVARAPAAIAGRIEVRGVGIVAMPHVAGSDVAIVFDLDGTPERMPEPAVRTVAGVTLPLAHVAPFEASAPIKVELLVKALAR